MKKVSPKKPSDLSEKTPPRKTPSPKAPSPKTIDAYIEGFPEPVRAKLREVRRVVRRVAPDATEKMGYGIPTFTQGKNLFHFAAFKKHVGLYPGPGAIEHFAEELERYETSKGTVRVPFEEPIPVAPIEKMVRFNLSI
jgi:uncharacterized protein YdhG (YjbR/CyaY superfamily)